MGGQMAEPGQFPFAVTIMKKPNMKVCVGTLILLDYVITAAHCVYNTPIWQLAVIAGSVDLYGYEFVNIKEIWIHEEYHGNENKFNNDIALINLVKPYQLSSMISNIKVSYEPIERGMTVTVIGWGKSVSIKGSTQ